VGESRADITQFLVDVSAGNRASIDRLLPVVYDELRRLAQAHLRSERPDHTLPATALVHEAYVRLVDQTRVNWQNRTHFFAVASQAIRRILIDHARARGRQRRGGGAALLSLDAARDVPDGLWQADLLDLDDALTRLAKGHPEKARVVEMRFFGGLTAEETAEAMGCALSTVERHWRFARAWLFRALAGEASP
jgi:RNA polymerase sigma factor (TIGR02999 family)